MTIITISICIYYCQCDVVCINYTQYIVRGCRHLFLTLSLQVTHQCVVDDLNLLITAWCRLLISSRFSSNSEASVSELLENLEEIYP